VSERATTGTLAAAVGLLLCIAPSLGAQPSPAAPHATLERATALFGEGNRLAAAGDEAGAREAFGGALLWYQRAAAELEPAVNGRLFYNIGNTYLRLDDVGRAIAAYRRAERMIPGDRNLGQSLDHARSLRQVSVGGGDGRWIGAPLLAWHRFIPSAVRVAMLLVAFNVAWLAGAGLLLLRRRGSEGDGAAGPSAPRRWLRGVTIAATALVVAAAISLTVETVEQRRPAGVIVPTQVVGRLGDSLAYDPSHSAPLTAGIEFRVITRRGGWLHIALPDRSRSWVPEFAAELL